MTDHMSVATHEPLSRAEAHQAVLRMRQSVAHLHELFTLNVGADLDTFFKVLDTKLIPRLDPAYLLMVAITGGGSTGKSSLFNALIGKNISAVQARAGLSRRVLAAMHPDVLAQPDFLPNLFAAFDAEPQPLQNADELTTPGPPRYITADTLPRNLVLLDTPDFDTGDRENYANRDLAKPVLEASDVLMYIFVNSTYNNRGNTDFIRHVLTDVGRRQTLLVYRCSKSFSEADVREHAEVVARNIYGETGKQNCLGVFRADESDDVARGETPLTIRPLANQPGIREVLQSLNPAQTRRKLIASALADGQRVAAETLRAARAELLKLSLYQDAIRAATTWAVTQALKSFPQDELLRLFARKWEETQPGWLRGVKKVGKLAALPMKLPLKAAQKMKEALSGDTPHPPPPAASPELIMEKNLREAANELRNQVLNAAVSVTVSAKDVAAQMKEIGTWPADQQRNAPRFEALDRRTGNLHAPRPAALDASAATLQSADWKATLDKIVAAARQPIQQTERLDRELRALAQRFRADMSARQKVRETLSAALTLVPTVGAAVYVFGTADAATGSAIYAKLAGLFGANDLWALAAIPASHGLNQVDRRNLEKLLSPIFAIWFNDKAAAVQAIFEEHITGAVLPKTAELANEAAKPITELNAALETIRGAHPHE